MDFACTSCSFVNETRRGTFPRYCGNCGSDMGQQENYPCQALEQPTPWRDVLIDPVQKSAPALSERMRIWNALGDLCEAVHAQAGWSMVPWSPNHRVVHLEAVHGGEAHFSVYAPYTEAQGKLAGTCRVKLEALTPDFLKTLAERTLALHTGDYLSLTVLPKALSEVDARPRTPGMPGMGAGTANLPFGSGGGTMHGKGMDEIHGDIGGSGPAFGPADKGDYVGFSQGARREQPKSEGEDEDESTVDDFSMTAPLPPDRRADVAERALAIPRSQMPQIRSDLVPEFLEWIKEKFGVSHRRMAAASGSLSGIQKEINPAKVEAMKSLGVQKLGEKPVLTSSDGYILDGHHRWAALKEIDEKAKLNTYRVNAPIRKVLELAKKFPKVFSKGVAEGIQELGTMGGYGSGMTAKTSPAPGSSRDLSVAQRGSVAHGDSQPIRSSEGKPKGKTVTDQSGDLGGLYGTPFEEAFSHVLDEAEYFQFIGEGIHDPHILKAVFMAGGGGSGKGWVSSNMFAGVGLKVVNSDNVLEAFAGDPTLRAKFKDLAALRPGETYDLGKNADMMSPDIQKLIRPKAKVVASGRMGLYMKGRLGLIIDSTGRRMGSVQKTKKLLEEAGYDTAMVFVDVDIETAQRRNLMRARKVDPGVLTKAHKEIRGNIPNFESMFGSKYLRIDNRDAPSGKVAEVTTAMRKAGMKLLRGNVQNPRGRAWIQAQQNAIKKLRESMGDGETASREATDYATLGSKVWDAAVAVIIKGHRDILVGKVAQDADDDRAGTWCFPGGGLDPEDGGDPVSAAIREAMEETGVTVTSEGKVLSHKDKPGVAFVICEYVKGDLAPNEEFTSLEWMPHSARHTFPGLYPINKSILERIPPGMIKGQAGQVESFLGDLRALLDEKGLSKGTKIGGTDANAVGKDRQVSGGSPAQPSKNTEPGTSLKSPDKQKEISTALSDLSKEVKTLSPPKDPNDATSPDPQAGADDARAKLQKDAEKEKDAAANGNGAPAPGGAKPPPAGGAGAAPKAAPAAAGQATPPAAAGAKPAAPGQQPGQPGPQTQQAQPPGQNGPQAPPGQPGQQPPGQQPGQAPGGQHPPGQPGQNGQDQNGSKVKIGADGSMTVQQGPQGAPGGQQPPGAQGDPMAQQDPMAAAQAQAQGQQPGQPGAADQTGSLFAAKAVNLTFLDKTAADRAEKWLSMQGVPPVGRDGTTVQINVQNPDHWVVVKATAKAFGLEMSGLV